MIFLFLFLLFLSSESHRLIALDFGSEWLKICSINPQGLEMFSIVVNEQSNRRTPALIGVDASGERLYGESALTAFSKNPSSVFPFLKRLLGQKINSPIVTLFNQEFGNFYSLEKQKNRDSVAFSKGSESLDIEYLLVLLLRYVKSLAEQHILLGEGETVSLEDMVIVFPEYYSLSERKLLQQLAGIAGLKVLDGWNELSTVAIDYGVRNLKAGESKTVVFYNIGAHTTTASLVKLEKGETLQITPLATEFDSSVGGFSFDIVLRDHFAKEFELKNKKLPSVKNNKRAMAKILREARQAKEQLSANPTVAVMLEEVHEGAALKLTLNREEFETMSEQYFQKVLEPLRKVLEKAGSGPIDVELFGGGVRIPKIQQLITSNFPVVTLGRHVDGDEASVFGAAHYAATLTDATKLIKVEIHGDKAAEAHDWSVGELSASEESALRQRLAQDEAQFRAKQEREEARNLLETTLMDFKEKVEKVKKKDIKQKATSYLDELSIFLEDNEPANLTPEEWKDKTTQVKNHLNSLLSIKEETEEQKEQRKKKAEAEAEAFRKRREKRPKKNRRQRDEL